MGLQVLAGQMVGLAQDILNLQEQHATRLKEIFQRFVADWEASAQDETATTVFKGRALLERNAKSCMPSPPTSSFAS